jgi:hypothetical protein
MAPASGLGDFAWAGGLEEEEAGCWAHKAVASRARRTLAENRAMCHVRGFRPSVSAGRPPDSRRNGGATI